MFSTVIFSILSDFMSIIPTFTWNVNPSKVLNTDIFYTSNVTGGG